MSLEGKKQNLDQVVKKLQTNNRKSVYYIPIDELLIKRKTTDKKNSGRIGMLFSCKNKLMSIVFVNDFHAYNTLLLIVLQTNITSTLY